MADRPRRGVMPPGERFANLLEEFCNAHADLHCENSPDEFGYTKLKDCHLTRLLRVQEARKKLIDGVNEILKPAGI